MAVYAAYRHIELDKIGYGKKRTMKQPPGGDCHDLFGAEFKGSPCHHRVLKPPGGGTSDIFGRPETVEQSPRRSRPVNHLQSSLFAAETNGTTTEPPSTPRNKPGNDSYARLFGPSEDRPPSTTKCNYLKSSIPFGLASTVGESMSSNSSSNADSPNSSTTDGAVAVNGGHSTPQAARRNPVTGDGVSQPVLKRSPWKRDANPVTGEAYTNGEKETSSPSAPATTNGSDSAQARRGRVPPGGFSSGLW